MSHDSLLSNIRQIVMLRLSQLGATVGDELEETILVRDGFYCGRRFRCGALQAIWFIEERQLKLFSSDGSLASVEVITADGQSVEAA